MKKYGTRLAALLLLAISSQMLGCNVDSFFDPSVTGRFEFTPTTIPILDRIDVIEQQDNLWGQTTGVTPADLMPNDLAYRIAPGDVVTVQVFELLTTGTWSPYTRRINASGDFRIPELGDVRAAGMTAQEFEDRLVELLEEQVLTNPQVQVVVEQGSAFRYTLYGNVRSPGLYTLSTPDLRLLDALASAGGVPLSTENIYIIRQVTLTDEYEPDFDTPRSSDSGSPPREQPSVEELIDQLEDGQDVSPGLFYQEGEPPIDVDDLEPVRVAEPPSVDISDVQGATEQTDSEGDSTYIYVEERGEWVKVRAQPGQGDGSYAETVAADSEMILERVIKVDYDRLSHGDGSYNIVVRPNDRIYVDAPPFGVVYIDGEIGRPGVYQLPATGRLTLSRLVAAAGGFRATAIPERVDLTRIVGEQREATVRLNLAAIRQRTEPDIYMKPDDHIIIGTNWFATPLAIIRNGFRATYGFGFLLDRNFGNDVFGAPPSNREF